MHRPLVSVTLPNYNYGRFLCETIESVLQQDYTNLEVLFVDDGSTDNSREIAEEFARRDPRFKPVFFERNAGVVAALANAWQRAQGDIIYQFSSDDALCCRDFFGLGVQALADYPVAAGFFGLTETVSSETGDAIGRMGSALREGYMAPQEFTRGFLQGRVFVPGISSLWRRKLILAIGGYVSALGPQVDYFVNHVLPAKHGVVFASRTFAKARVSERRNSYSSNTTLEAAVHRFMLFERMMRASIPAYIGQDEDWQRWRSAQLQFMVAQHTLIPRWVIWIKVHLRHWLPGGVFRFITYCWRYSLGAVIRVTARFNLRYRTFSRHWRQI